MSKYIDAEELKKVIRANDWSNPAVPCAVSVIINYMPAADVEPVRHGHWEKVAGGVHFPFRCSRCKERADSNEYLYCHCGAKMDEV